MKNRLFSFLLVHRHRSPPFHEPILRSYVYYPGLAGILKSATAGCGQGSYSVFLDLRLIFPRVQLPCKQTGIWMHEGAGVSGENANRR